MQYCDELGARFDVSIVKRRLHMTTGLQTSRKYLVADWLTVSMTQTS